MDRASGRIERIEVEPGVRLAVELPVIDRDKPVVMLSNSIGANLAMWDELVARLAGTVNFVRYDTRGHGGSDVPVGPYSLERLGRDAVAVLDALKIERVVFCGLSLGGLTGMWLGAHQAKRLSGLVLANTAANFPPASLWQDRAASVRANGMVPLITATLDRWFTKSFQARSATRLAELAEMIGATPPEGYAACCEVLAAADMKPHLAEIACPVQVICGAHDPSTPPARGEEIVASVNGAAMVTLDAAHISAIEAAEAFVHELTQFLSRIGSATTSSLGGKT